MAEKKGKGFPIPVSLDLSMLLGSHRGSVPHAAGSGSYVPGTTGDVTAVEDLAPPVVDAPAETDPVPRGADPASVVLDAPAAGRGGATFSDLTAPRKPVLGVSERKKLIGALIDNLVSGAVRGPSGSNDLKVYSVQLSIPAVVYSSLAIVAGEPRQIGETLREALADFIGQCQFQATLAGFRVSLEKAYGAFVEVRKSGRKFGCGGMRPVKVSMNEEMSQRLAELSKDLGTTPIRLLESLAYQLSLMAPPKA